MLSFVAVFCQLDLYDSQDLERSFRIACIYSSKFLFELRSHNNHVNRTVPSPRFNIFLTHHISQTITHKLLRNNI